MKSPVSPFMHFASWGSVRGGSREWGFCAGFPSVAPPGLGVPAPLVLSCPFLAGVRSLYAFLNKDSDL